MEQPHSPQALWATLTLASLVMTMAGLVVLLGWAEIEIWFFDREVTSRGGLAAWVAIAAALSFVFGYLCWRSTRARRDPD